MDILYKIKCEVPLHISWNCFIPHNLNDWIQVRLSDKIKVKIGVTDEIVSIYLIGDPIDMSKTIFPTESLILEIEGYWPEEIAEMLRTQSKDIGLLITFKQDIQEIFKQVHSGLVNNLRNHFGQWWLSETSPFEKTVFYDALWLDNDGQWKRIFPKIHVLNTHLYGFGISEEDWKELGGRLQNNTKIEMIKTLMANAHAHLDNENSRLAIVESVCALEASIKQDIPSLLSEVVKPPISDKLLDSAIEKMGFLLTTKIFFEHTSEKFHLDPISCEKCLKAIQIRNEIIHKKRQTVALTEARQYVAAIGQIIRSLNNFETITAPTIIEENT